MPKPSKTLPVKPKSKAKQTRTRAKSTSLNKSPGLKRWTMIPTVLAVALVGYFVVSSSFASSRKPKQYIEDKTRSFIDISSPQCGSLARIGNYTYGIVGLNGTWMNFGINGCVGAEVSHFRTYDLYVGANYPSSECRNLSPYDCGRKAASFDLGLISMNRLRPRMLWIDVETGRGIPWSNTGSNWSFLRGLEDGLRRGNYSIGYYSTDGMWRSVTGGQRVSNSVWYATGKNNARDAKASCNKSFGGRRPTYVQYIQNGLDTNVRC